jgi:hypothetical protein
MVKAKKQSLYFFQLINQPLAASLSAIVRAVNMKQGKHIGVIVIKNAAVMPIN